MAENTTAKHIHRAWRSVLSCWFVLGLTSSFGCRSPQQPSVQPSSGSASAEVVTAPTEGTASPSFLSAPGPAVSLRCTTLALDMAHGEWSSQTTQHVRTFEHVLGTVEVQRWKAEQNEGPATMWDVKSDGSRIEWMPQAAIVWPLGANPTCEESASTDPLQPVVCARVHEAGAPWDVQLAVDSSTPLELSTALNSFLNAPEEAEAVPSNCQLVAAVWQSTGPVPGRTEIHMRWCDESGPVYVQRRRVAHGVSRLQLERCQPEAGAGPE